MYVCEWYVEESEIVLGDGDESQTIRRRGGLSDRLSLRVDHSGHRRCTFFTDQNLYSLSLSLSLFLSLFIYKTHTHTQTNTYETHSHTTLTHSLSRYKTHSLTLTRIAGVSCDSDTWVRDGNG